MTKNQPSNIAASVRNRLLNKIRETGDDANLIWSRYAVERLLYRISVSDYSSDFLLKGAMLFMVWTGQPYRPTVDLDLLGHGLDSSERIAKVFREICRIDVAPDGLHFDHATIKVAPIRADQEYHGQRISLTAYLENARIPVQVDIGFGDIVTPDAEEIVYPTLLDFPSPRVRAYPRETFVAEKLQAIVALGIANSRMKDFFDLLVLARDFSFEGGILTEAIEATFERRRTEIPSEEPLAFTDEFGRDEIKTVQWKAFIRKSGLDLEKPELPNVLAKLREFLLPPLEAASRRGDDLGEWKAGGPWSSPRDDKS